MQHIRNHRVSNQQIIIHSYRCLNKIDNMVKVQKDQTEHNYKSNIVYKIYCHKIAMRRTLVRPSNNENKGTFQQY